MLDFILRLLGRNTPEAEQRKLELRAMYAAAPKQPSDIPCSEYTCPHCGASNLWFADECYSCGAQRIVRIRAWIYTGPALKRVFTREAGNIMFTSELLQDMTHAESIATTVEATSSISVPAANFYNVGRFMDNAGNLTQFMYGYLPLDKGRNGVAPAKIRLSNALEQSVFDLCNQYYCVPTANHLVLGLGTD